MRPLKGANLKTTPWEYRCGLVGSELPYNDIRPEFNHFRQKGIRKNTRFQNLLSAVLWQKLLRRNKIATPPLMGKK